MGETASGIIYPDNNDFPGIPDDLKVMADTTEAALGGLQTAIDAISVPVVSALPATAANGDEVDLAVGTGTTRLLWRFRYDTAETSAYKWFPVGATPLTARVETIGTINPGGGNDWQTLAGTDVAGPSVVLPARGYYAVQFGARINSASDGQAAQAGASIAGSDPTGNNVAENANTRSASVVGTTDAFNAEYLAGATLRMMYRCSGTGGTASYGVRWLRAFPLKARA